MVELTTEYSYNQYSPDFMAGKTSSNGNLIVNEDSQHSTYQLVVRDLSVDFPGELPWSSGSPKNIFIGPTNTTGSVHPALSSPSYVYGGFFRATGHPTPWVAYHDEIVQITVQDASINGNQVLRLAHAWSNFYDSSWDEIPTYASPDGKYVIFYSNWNGANASARHDIFIVSASNFYRSDVDNSSATNTTDALLTLRNSLGLSMDGTAWQASATTGDVNCDEVSNSTDALLILRYSLGLNMGETGWCE